MSEASVWHEEQKTQQAKEYYILVKDGEETIPFILRYNAVTKSVGVEPYSPPDINYTIHDGCDHENDECFLDDPDSEESHDVFMAEQYGYAERNLDLLEKQLKDKSAIERIIARKEALEVITKQAKGE